MKQNYIKPSMKVVNIHHKPSLMITSGQANSVNGNVFKGSITGSTVSARSCDGGWDDDE